MKAEHAYTAGRNCALHGPDESNCHFSLFSRPDLTAAWEQGKADMEAEMQNAVDIENQVDADDK